MASVVGRQLLPMAAPTACHRDRLLPAVASCSSSLASSLVFSAPDRRRYSRAASNRHTQVACLVSASVRGGVQARLPNLGNAADGGGVVVRKLILLRHADSDNAAIGVRDHDRSISSKGKREVCLSTQGQSSGWVSGKEQRRCKRYGIWVEGISILLQSQLGLCISWFTGLVLLAAQWRTVRLFCRRGQEFGE